MTAHSPYQPLLTSSTLPWGTWISDIIESNKRKDKYTCLLKGNLFYSGDDLRFAKEQWHISYEFTEKKKAATVSSLIEGKWIGYKFVVYNIEENDDNDGKNNNDGKKTVVKTENWLDMDNTGKDWVKETNILMMVDGDVKVKNVAEKQQTR